jgi:hypothetical protein
MGMQKVSIIVSYIHKASAKTNFRVLDAFPSRDVPGGYVHLLEAIFMFFFYSCRRPQHCSRFMNDECHEIMRTLRIDSDIPRVQWTGLNAAWPAVQGFRMDRVPCKNKACCGKFSHAVGFVFCYIYTTFKAWPTNAEISRLMSEGQKLDAARAKAGPNPPCGDCRRREDFFPVKHLMYHLAPGVLLCGACIMQLKTHGVMHTPEEKAKLVGVSASISRRRTEEVLCDNCAVPESSHLTRQHFYNTETGQVLCSACDSYRHFSPLQQRRFLRKIKTILLLILPKASNYFAGESSVSLVEMSSSSSSSSSSVSLVGILICFGRVISS